MDSEPRQAFKIEPFSKKTKDESLKEAYKRPRSIKVIKL